MWVLWGGSPAPPHPAKKQLLRLLLHRPYADFAHRVIFFLRYRPDHPGKLHLVTDDRRSP
ncbi:hypothetical protein [Enterobacter hormaechei]|uniref:hypothetical protein n=1 Tax=Enterobacter hormaechei TaxID=158836 RepID=UPI003F96F255